MMLGARMVVTMPAPYAVIARRRVAWFHLCGLVGGIAWLLVAGLGARFRGLPTAPVMVLAGVAVVTFLVMVIGTALVVGEGRLTWFHHQVGILAASAMTVLLVDLPVLAYLDLAGTALLGFAVFGRLGCLLVGCCHGRPARRGVVYGPAHVDAGLPSTYAGRVLIPVQLLEAGAAAMLVLACLFTLASTAPAGVALTLSLIGYAGARFVLELLRGDVRPRIAGLSEAQWTALAVTVAALVVWVSIVVQA